MSCYQNSFFTLNSATSTALLRSGRISIPSIASGGVSTPCLLVRTSRFLVQHLTPDNLDLTIPADSSILEMDIDYIIENEAIIKNCPMSLAELAGVSGKRAVCLATRVHSTNEKLTKSSKSISNNQPINGEDFVRVQNATGSSKFELKDMETIIQRFSPDFFIGPFDEHPIPMSLKRVRKAVERNLKYEKFCEETHLKLKDSISNSKTSFPFVSSILGAEIISEKERNIAGISEKSSGISFCDLHKISSLEERLEVLKGVSSVPGREGLLRILRGAVEPGEMIKYLPFVDVFDTTFVDELTAKGHALQLNFDSSLLSNSPEPINLWDEKYFDDFEAISKNCTCNSCKERNFYKRSYVHHLLKSHEMVAGVLLMMHNLHQYYRWLEHLKSNLVC